MTKLWMCGGLALVFVSAALAADDGPQPRVVTPGQAVGQPPSDAILLFDGHDMSHWTRKDGTPPRCSIEDAVLVCKTGSGDLYSKEKFRDAQLHVEFDIPNMPDQRGQLRGNSGVMIHGTYEIQILDSYQNPTYANGTCGALYGHTLPWSMPAVRPSSGSPATSFFTVPSAIPKII